MKEIRAKRLNENYGIKNPTECFKKFLDLTNFKLIKTKDKEGKDAYALKDVGDPYVNLYDIESKFFYSAKDIFKEMEEYIHSYPLDDIEYDLWELEIDHNEDLQPEEAIQILDSETFKKKYPETYKKYHTGTSQLDMVKLFLDDGKGVDLERIVTPIIKERKMEENLYIHTDKNDKRLGIYDTQEEAEEKWKDGDYILDVDNQTLYKKKGEVEESKKLTEEDDEENGIYELNTNVTGILDAGQYGNPYLELPAEVKVTDENLKKWDELIIETAKPYIEDALKEVDETITVDNFSYYHPRFYNYETDEINFRIKINPSKVEELKEKYLADEKFVEFLKEFKSRDGFFSRLADNVEDFKKQENWKTLAQIIKYEARKGYNTRNSGLQQDLIDVSVYDAAYDFELEDDLEECFARELDEELTNKDIVEIEKELEDILKEYPEGHSIEVKTEEEKEYAKNRLKEKGYEVEVSGNDLADRYHIEYYKKELKEDTEETKELPKLTKEEAEDIAKEEYLFGTYEAVEKLEEKGFDCKEFFDRVERISEDEIPAIVVEETKKELYKKLGIEDIMAEAEDTLWDRADDDEFLFM